MSLSPITYNDLGLLARVYAFDFPKHSENKLKIISCD